MLSISANKDLPGDPEFPFGRLTSFQSQSTGTVRINDYDPIADVFDESMAFDFHDATHAIRERVAAAVHNDGSLHCLDLCCGSGLFLFRLSKTYRLRGVGIDLSTKQVALATKRAKEGGVQVAHVVADIRTFNYPESVDLLTINFDALNHLGSTEEWEGVFEQSFRGLRVGGAFLFDVNLPERLLLDWDSPEVIIKDNVVYVQIAHSAEVIGTCVKRRTPMVFFARRFKSEVQQGSIDGMAE